MLIKGILISFVLLFSTAIETWSQVRVRGYTRKDGTYVRPHYRSSPNSTKSDNWITKGNINPYTGEVGTRNPYTVMAAPVPRTILPQTSRTSPIQGAAPATVLSPRAAANASGSQKTTAHNSASVQDRSLPPGQQATGPLLDERAELVKYQEKLTSKGNPQAQSVMGLRHLHGIDIAKDEEKGMGYPKAARANGEITRTR